MWKISFKQFIKNLQQNKLFTFLNLFGISITIFIILIAAIKIESAIWPGGPEKNADNILFVQNEVVSSDNRTSMGGINIHIIDDYILKMKTPKAIAFNSSTEWSYFGVNGMEAFTLKNVNAGWWQVLDYDFIEGRGFNKKEEKQADNVVIIDEKIKKRFFPNKNALGEMIEISGNQYKILGVIKVVSGNCIFSKANVFRPYTINKSNSKDIMKTGSFGLALLSDNGENIDQIKKEFENIRQQINSHLDKGFTISFGGPDSPLESYLRDWSSPQQYIGHTKKMLLILSRFLFILILPAINLISIQLIRVHQRSEEIGVRKAFGASRSDLIKQILYENILLSFLGAMIGLFLCLIVVYGFGDFLKSVLFHNRGVNIDLSINYKLFFISMIASLVFSFISGLIPALKISKVQTIDVLRGGVL